MPTTKNSRQLQDVRWPQKLARLCRPPGKGTRIFWHVGYARTSTTWLQEGVFPAFPRLNYLGIRYLPSYRYQWDLVTSCALRMPPRYDENFVRREWQSLMRNDRPNLFSSEGFWRPFPGRAVAERLRGIVPGSENHVLIGIRRQDGHLFSRYAHDLQAFHAPIARRKGLPEASFPSYSLAEALTEERAACRWPDCRMSSEVPAQLHKAEEPCACLERAAKVIPLWHYDFAAAAELWLEVFGPGRVHFILLEETARDQGRTIDRLAGMLGLDLSPKERSALAAIPARNSMESNSGDTMKELRATYLQPGGLAEKMREHFRASNRRLHELFPDLPLQEFGYY